MVESVAFALACEEKINNFPLGIHLRSNRCQTMRAAAFSHFFATHSRVSYTCKITLSPMALCNRWQFTLTRCPNGCSISVRVVCCVIAERRCSCVGQHSVSYDMSPANVHLAMAVLACGRARMIAAVMSETDLSQSHSTTFQSCMHYHACNHAPLIACYTNSLQMDAMDFENDIELSEMERKIIRDFRRGACSPPPDSGSRVVFTTGQGGHGRATVPSTAGPLPAVPGQGDDHREEASLAQA